MSMICILKIQLSLCDNEDHVFNLEKKQPLNAFNTLPEAYIWRQRKLAEGVLIDLVVLGHQCHSG